MLKSLNNLHHAYLVIGNSLEAEKYLHAFFESEGLKLSGSPDFFLYKEPLFGIEEARALSVSATRKAFIDKKIFLIAPEKLTHEAQNALLKTFEDPYPDTHFFLVVREEELILPTLRSRMQTVRVTRSNLVQTGQGSTLSLEAKKFLSLSIADRIAFAKKFADTEKNLSVFLDNLLSLLREDNNLMKSVEQVYKTRLVSDDRGVSVRLILEHLALVL